MDRTVVDTDKTEAELETLEADVCWDLVRSRSVGRFAVNRTGACPLVVPVNFVVDGETIAFRSGAGTKLDAAQRGLVALQVDEIDPLHHTGWSVLVEGRAGWVSGTHAVGVDTWAPGDRAHVIRLVATRITGRRIQLHQVDTDARGYR